VPVPEDGDVLSETETLGQDFYDRVAVAVGERIRQCGPRVPVVTGMLSESCTSLYVDRLAVF
jgi:aspartate kinase